MKFLGFTRGEKVTEKEIFDLNYVLLIGGWCPLCFYPGDGEEIRRGIDNIEPLVSCQWSDSICHLGEWKT